MEIQNYLSTRVEDQINWFDKKSNMNRRFYHFTKVMLTLVAALAPALSSFITDGKFIQIALSVASVLTAVLANISGIFSFKDKYTSFRQNAEYLKSEKYLFLNKAGKYKEENNNEAMFVETIENFLSRENQDWKKMVGSEQPPSGN
jgi:hypothetical protein